MQIALRQKGQAALWVTNGCTSMSKPITTQSTPMGVDNKLLTERDKQYCFVLPISFTINNPESIIYL